jgi:hypothetical protein
MQHDEEFIKNSKHFCILPWIHFHAWPDKRVMPCCVADSDISFTNINNDNTILEIMNADAFKDMRKALLNDEKHPACTRCYELEDYGTWTMRQSHNLDQGINNLDIIASTHDDGSIDEFNLKYMDIRFSNLCNFKCRSCGPGCSSLWGEEKLTVLPAGTWLNATGRDPLVTNNENGLLMEKLYPYLDDVEEVYFAGGEILVTPEHYECLDYWIANGLAKDIRLNYTTNMSKITYRDKSENRTRDLFDLWEHFGEIEIWASIDAIGPAGEIIRKGFNWEKIQNNLKTITERAPNIRVGITPTISIWNIFAYSEMFDYMLENGIITPDIPPRLNILTSPDYAAIGILPDHVRAKLIKEFKVHMRHFASIGDVQNRNRWAIIVDALEKGEEDKEKLKEFFEDNKNLDKIRNESILAVIPELREIKAWTET